MSVEIRYPNLTGNPSQQLQQLKSYLYQLADQMNMALRDIEQESQATTGERITLVDTVVAQGKSGIWTYRKWSSGLAECWGRATFTADVTSQWGGLYISGAASDRITYPFTFTAIPTEQATVRGNGWAAWLYANAANGVNTAAQTAAYQIVRGASATGVTYYIDYFVSGRWK